MLLLSLHSEIVGASVNCFQLMVVAKPTIAFSSTYSSVVITCQFSPMYIPKPKEGLPFSSNSRFRYYKKYKKIKIIIKHGTAVEAIAAGLVPRNLLTKIGFGSIAKTKHA